MLADPDCFVAIGRQLVDEQFVHIRAGLAVGTHLVDRHAQTPGCHSAKEGMLLQQQRLGALTGGAQGGANAGQPAAHDKDFGFIELSHGYSLLVLKNRYKVFTDWRLTALGNPSLSARQSVAGTRHLLRLFLIVRAGV